MINKRIYFFIFILLFSASNYAAPFENQASYTVCFTPPENCTQKIVNAIDHAHSNIWVQAYSFTSRPISTALANAKQRGINVQIILDKSNFNRPQLLRYLARRHIPIWIDQNVAIAHNKVIVIDTTKIITGSFNFTQAAQYKNAENVLIIDDATLAQKYLHNWQRRQKASRPYNAPAGTISDSDWSNKFWQALSHWLKHLK